MFSIDFCDPPPYNLNAFGFFTNISLKAKHLFDNNRSYPSVRAYRLALFVNIGILELSYRFQTR